MSKNDPIFTLHRYFIWANRMRAHFDEILQKKANGKIEKDRFNIESMMYMSLWYGIIYVVIEGWRKLKLKDHKINSLLCSQNVNLLKRYRNAVFHFQKPYFDKKFENFYKEKSTVPWVRQLNSEFGRYFLEYFKNKPTV